MQFGEMLVQVLVFSPLVSRARFAHIVTPAFAAMALGLLALPFAAAFAVVLALVGLVAAGSGILIPMLAYRISLQADNAQGAALGKQTAAASLGQGLGSVTAGWLFGLALQAPFLATAALMLAGALIGWRSGRA
jgi:MFS transporter, DHA1 family, multidrug resistance protein